MPSRPPLARRTRSGLWESWEQVVAPDPGAVALIEAESGEMWSRARLHSAATALVAGPLAPASGQQVGFSLPNGHEWMALFLGLQALGAAAVPLDPSMTPEQQDQVATALGLRFVWREGTLHELNPSARPARSMRLGKLTSGTTGAPRMIRCTAEHLLADGRNIIASMGLRSDDRNLALIPLGHSYGLGNLVAPLLIQGSAVVTARAFVPRQAVEWIAAHEVTVLPGVPSILRLLASIPGREPFAPLRLVISAGARLPTETAAAFQQRAGLPIHNFYGSSETGGICYDRSGVLSAGGDAIGSALEGVKVSLSERGRVRVSSRAVAAGRSGTFTLPDYGRINARGDLEITGRAGRVANLGGRNLHPRDLEIRLSRLPGVTDAWVDVRSESGRDYLIAAAETTRSEAELVAEFSRHVAAWQMPRSWLVAPQLPRTSRGKLDAAALRARLQLRITRPADAPR